MGAAGEKSGSGAADLRHADAAIPAANPAGAPALDHLGIAVRSLAQARSMYELLGLTGSAEELIEQEQVRTVMLALGQAGAPRIELLEPTAEDSTLGRYLSRRGEGLHHIALRVEDLDSRFQALREAGVRLASEEIRAGAGGHRYFFVHPGSSNGVLIELVEAGPPVQPHGGSPVEPQEGPAAESLAGSG